MNKKDYTTPSTKTIKEIFKKDKREKYLYYKVYLYCYRLFWQLVRLPGDIRRYIVTFYQRGKRGWANSDTWGFDFYLTDIIIEGMTHLRKYAHGHPQNVNNLREWKKILQQIINGFKAYKRACNYTIRTKKSTYEQNIKKFDKGMKLLRKYYGAFWD